MFFIASVLDVALYFCVVLVSKEHKYKYIHYKMGQVETSYKNHAEDAMYVSYVLVHFGIEVVPSGDFV